MARWVSVCCVALLMFLAVFVLHGGAQESPFELVEVGVKASPGETHRLDLGGSEKLLDFDVSPGGPEVAVLVEQQPRKFKVVFWTIGGAASPKAWELPADFTPRAIAWHPAERKLFLAGSRGAEHIILKATGKGDSWEARAIYKSAREIRRLVPAPRPFATSYDERSGKYVNEYRIFFGVKGTDGAHAIRSVTEDGKRDYQVIGRKEGFTELKDAEVPPSRLTARSALPLGFHPAGHLLLWEGENRCFHYARYDRDHWGDSAPLYGGKLCGGTVTPLPNGMGVIRWRSGSPGVTVFLDGGKSTIPQATGYTFRSTPSSVPDGRGIVGLVKSEKGGSSLVYAPIDVPLADVANAWMFAESRQDRELFAGNGGLLRDLPDDQLYSLYESEAYYCGGYDQSTPTRPYLVTSDIFWELFAAAYEGIFIVKERLQAIPAFWEFVDAADAYFRQSTPGSRWAGVFSTLAELSRSPSEPKSDELKRILGARAREFSPMLDAEADYGELKPRGHYTSTEAMKTYFMAFKYLTDLAGGSLDLGDLALMPAGLKNKALAWVRPYENFIAQPRAPLVWKENGSPPPAFSRHPVEEPRLFPLSWGFDNEVLLSTVYHQSWPEGEQIIGPSGPRIVPSGLDIAAALGSSFATALLEGELNKYPPLRNAIQDLHARFDAKGRAGPESRNLYDRWITALALQWAEDVESPNGHLDETLWRARRLQTGLASWATLRHATVLVNERTAAECGEAGFEPILLRPPRGYVEPDPRIFEAVAALFETIAESLKPEELQLKGEADFEDSGNTEPLRQGILRRLAETAGKARLFKAMAEKELRGESLTDREYEEILYVGRVAEHNFLVFKSLAAEEYGLSTPDPMPKIADAAGGGPMAVPFLMVAVGRPMEWDHIVPFFGRREIVKGAVYSYYEFPSETLLDDKEWLGKLPSQPHPDWIKPFLSKDKPSCPARDPY